jgi:hypothetical protein
VRFRQRLGGLLDAAAAVLDTLEGPRRRRCPPPPAATVLGRCHTCGALFYYHPQTVTCRRVDPLTGWTPGPLDEAAWARSRLAVYCGRCVAGIRAMAAAERKALPASWWNS